MSNNKTVLAEIELSYKPKKSHHPIIKSSDDVYYHLLRFFPEETIALQERFVVGYLNRSNRLLGVYEASVGGITGTVVDIRLILSVALKSAAVGMVLMHNHPSGNHQPSQADIDLTKKVKDTSKLFDINIIDHLIVSSNPGYYSFAEEGNL